MTSHLDGPLWAIVRREPGVLAPLTARAKAVRSLLVFTSEAAAGAHLRALPPEVAPAWTVASWEARDRRGKEELLRAAAAAGTTRLDLDPDLDLRPERAVPLAKAIAYVASFKRATACL